MSQKFAEHIVYRWLFDLQSRRDEMFIEAQKIDLRARGTKCWLAATHLVPLELRKVHLAISAINIWARRGKALAALYSAKPLVTRHQALAIASFRLSTKFCRVLIKLGAF